MAERYTVAYFGTGDWRHCGIKAYPLPYYLRSSGTGTYKLHPGIYCISATRLQQIYMLKTSHWTESLEKSYQRLGREMREFEETDNTKEARSSLLSRKDEGFKKRFDTFQKLRFGRLCAYLRGREPDEHVGHSILIYRLTEEDLQQALHAPWRFSSASTPDASYPVKLSAKMTKSARSTSLSLSKSL